MMIYEHFLEPGSMFSEWVFEEIWKFPKSIELIDLIS